MQSTHRWPAVYIMLEVQQPSCLGLPLSVHSYQDCPLFLLGRTAVGDATIITTTDALISTSRPANTVNTIPRVFSLPELPNSYKCESALWDWFALALFWCKVFNLATGCPLRSSINLWSAIRHIYLFYSEVSLLQMLPASSLSSPLKNTSPQ